MERICKKCGEPQSIEMFCNPSCKDGIGFICKGCKNKNRREWYRKRVELEPSYRININKRMRRYRNTSDVYKKRRESLKEFKSKYDKERLAGISKEARQEYARNYYIRNKEEKIRKAASYYKLNKGKRLEYARNRIISLGDAYIVNRLENKFKLKGNTIKQNPELIKVYRNCLKIKRLIKNQK